MTGRQQRLLVHLTIAIVIAFYFWVASRYPALDSKEGFQAVDSFRELLSMHPKYTSKPGDSIFQTMWISLLNWLDINQKGMTFGLLFGAAMYSTLPYLTRMKLSDRFGARAKRSMNTFAGLIMGTPLGVCVNCAAPIARGLAAGGAQIETALAVMLASPTLNVVVLSLLFTALPSHFGALKVALSIFTILIALPLVLRNSNTPKLLTPPEVKDLPKTSFLYAVRDGIFEYLTNLKKIIIDTVPLMILAGIIGAILSQTVPVHVFRSTDLAAYFGLTFVATLVPAPITMDIFIAQMLFRGGVEHLLVMPILYSTGIFSIYSMFIVGTTYGWRIAVKLFTVIYLIALASGPLAQFIYDQDFLRLENLKYAFNSSTIESHKSYNFTRPANEFTRPKSPRIYKSEKVEITQTKHLKKSKGNKLIERVQVPGIENYVEESFLEMTVAPFSHGRSTAAADIDQDGFTDIVMASEKSVIVYQNLSGESFKTVHLKLMPKEHENIMIAAFVDIDNDTWFDLAITSYGEGLTRIFKNNQGAYDSQNYIELPENIGNTPSALNFADIDKDGDLDIYLGFWQWNLTDHNPHPTAANYWYINDGNSFRKVDIQEELGETLSVLFSDINKDGHVDLFVGNDFEPPEQYYWGGPNNKWVKWTKNAPLATNSRTTMSIDSADINNDLELDLFVAQIGLPLKVVPHRDVDTRYCDGLKDPMMYERCQNKINVSPKVNYLRSKPSSLEHCKPPFKQPCQDTLLAVLSARDKNSELCKKIQGASERRFCNLANQKSDRPAFEDGPNDPPQVPEINTLFLGPIKPGITVENSAEQWDVVNLDWAWNAKFADLDSDGYQDLYIANGILDFEFIANNLLYLNQAGQTFKLINDELGYEDYRATGSYVYVDFDFDGDLDIISNSISYGIQILQNNFPQQNTVTIELEDLGGNRLSIGTQLTITDNLGKKQIRELKVGGGYKSYDPPTFHFGLGEATSIKEINLHTSTNKNYRIDVNLDSGHHYKIKTLLK